MRVSTNQSVVSILQILDFKDVESITELSHKTGMAYPTVWDWTDELEKSGLVNKVKDGRRVSITLTEDGRLLSGLVVKIITLESDISNRHVRDYEVV